MWAVRVPASVQNLDQKMVIVLSKTRCCRNRRGHQHCHSLDSCDTAAVDGRLGSNVYKVKHGLSQWQFQVGRGKLGLGGLSIEKTGARKKAAQKERLLR